MKALVAVIATLCLALLIQDCHQGQVGVFTAAGYSVPRYGYVVHFANPAKRALMPPGWEIDNLYLKRTASGTRLRARTGADYESELYLDVDQDGTEDKLGKVQTFDLRFTNRRTAGIISLRTIPLDLDMRDKELRVMLDSVVESISGSGYETIQLGGSLYLANKQHRYAAKIISKSKAVLAGNKAYVAVVDISNVDRLRVDPKAVDARVMLVLARTPLLYAHKHYGGKTLFPVLMMATYSNSPEDFAASLPDFKAFLGRIQLGRHMGFEMKQAPSPPDASITPAKASDAGPVAAEASVEADAGQASSGGDAGDAGDAGASSADAAH